MKRRSFRHILAAAAVLCALACGLWGCSATDDPEPVSITVWTYYNGDQLSAFQALVDEFNDTVGADQGIAVEGSNLGSVNDLQDAVLNSANGKVGAPPVPNIFMAYADTAYEVDHMGLLVDLAPYLTQEERDQYVEGYLEEGTLGEPDSIKLFPIAKSVELLLVNKTDFDVFAAETGASYDDLATVEGVVRVAERYYEWTDAQTPEPNDGQAFFGRDSLANYCLIGAKQLGVSFVEVRDGQASLDFDRGVARKLWDNYYVPYVKGYFDASARYRSDDIKTGNIIALVGSSSGATYFPSQVTDDAGDQRDIEMQALPCPQFEGGQPYAVQQGAGLAVVDKSQREVEASIEFLKWFTAEQQNLQFSISSGYLPVMKSANDMGAVRALEGEIDPRMENILTAAMSEVAENTPYTPQAFESGTAFRDVLEHAMSEAAASDAADVREKVAAGVQRDDALAPYLSDERFQEWYDDTLERLEALV